jgi:hypothetical protein
MMSHRCHSESLKTTQLDSFGLILITTMTYSDFAIPWSWRYRVAYSIHKFNGYQHLIALHNCIEKQSCYDSVAKHGQTGPR